MKDLALVARETLSEDERRQFIESGHKSMKILQTILNKRNLYMTAIDTAKNTDQVELNAFRYAPMDLNEVKRRIIGCGTRRIRGISTATYDDTEQGLSKIAIYLIHTYPLFTVIRIQIIKY